MIQFREKELEVLDLSRDSILEKVKNLQMKDRDLMDKAQKAFVSFVRGYKEHQCNYIFQWNKLDYGCLAEGLGLLFVILRNPFACACNQYSDSQVFFFLISSPECLT